MSMQRFMASQFRKPSGWFGSLVMRALMNRFNRQIIDTTLELLELTPDNHVLEIGFGGDGALSQLAQRLTAGKVSGVDFSEDMVRRAKRKFRREIDRSRIQLQLGDVSQLPYPDAVFDRVFTINTIYFWPDALQGVAEIRRVLKAGGRAAVSIRSKEKMQKHAGTEHGFHLFSANDLADAMRQSGFPDVGVDHRDREHWYDQVIVTGIR